jgi:release factor glutamine methyltransferase
MKALNKLQELSKTLKQLDIEHSGKEAELMIRYGLGMSLVDLLKDNPEISDAQNMVIDNMVNRRRRREPLQYILGDTDFLGLKISVGPGVLIPRPETELMGEYAVKALSSQLSALSSKNRYTSILDLCTGSGCLALAIAQSFPESSITAVDISEDALHYARNNAELNNINNIKFLKGHLFNVLENDISFDFIISNPPYIRSMAIEALQPEIKDWEPVNALDGGDDGMDFYRKIISEARGYLKDNGTIMFELGIDCADSVAVMFEESGYSQITIKKDYAGIERIISAQK